MTNKELMTRLTMLEREVALLRCRVEKMKWRFPRWGKSTMTPTLTITNH